MNPPIVGRYPRIFSCAKPLISLWSENIVWINQLNLYAGLSFSVYSLWLNINRLAAVSAPKTDEGNFVLVGGLVSFSHEKLAVRFQGFRGFDWF